MRRNFENSSLHIVRNFLLLNIEGNHADEGLCQKVDNLNTTDDWESSKKAHSASNETQLRLGFDLPVLLYVVEGCCVKEDLDDLKGWIFKLFP